MNGLPWDLDWYKLPASATSSDIWHLRILVDGFAYVAGIWSVTVIVVQLLGSFKLFRNYSSPPPQPVSPNLNAKDVPHITVIRPVKGLEPRLYECLASTVQQAYPRDRLTIHLCVASKSDPAYPVLEKIASDFADHDVRIFVEFEDPFLHGPDGDAKNLGPNPKVRNISRGYREAKGDVIWIVDCNVWVSKRAAGRMVDKLMGFSADSEPAGAAKKPYKFVHQLPLSVDITPPGERSPWVTGGGRLDEMFMATSHAKFYSAINTVGVAPCIVGKSNMFRKSDLDRLTDPAQNPILSAWEVARGRGIDFFSSYICEDHLIGDLLWRSYVLGHRNHGLVRGEVAVQPMADTSVAAYIARRVRWLRVRKWTVIAATLVEPGVESLLNSLYLSFALTTIPWFRESWGVPPTWTAMAVAWTASVGAWMALDWTVYWMLHSCWPVEADADTPDFARGAGRPGGTEGRPFFQWVCAWWGRELLALPIWTWAVLLGTTVTWRGKSFRVRMDMSVVELPDGSVPSPMPPLANGTGRGAQQAIPSGLVTGRGKLHGD